MIYVFIYYNNICFYIFIITYVLYSLSSHDSVHSFPHKTSNFSKKYQKILEKSNSCFLTSKNSFCIFRGSFGNFFVGNRNYSHPFHQIVSIKNYQIILQNCKFHIFLRKMRIWRIFLFFS
jgi:hypothetical protein